MLLGQNNGLLGDVSGLNRRSAKRRLNSGISHFCYPYYETAFAKFNRYFRYFQDGPLQSVKYPENYSEKEKDELLAWGS